MWEQRGTKNLPVRWHPHYNNLHLTVDLMYESKLIGLKTNRKLYKGTFDNIKCVKVQIYFHKNGLKIKFLKTILRTLFPYVYIADSRLYHEVVSCYCRNRLFSYVR